MRTRYLTGIVRAQRDTAMAFLCTFDWSDDHGYVALDQWIPLSVIHPEDHDTISDAVERDLIEISIAEWWVIRNL